VKTNHPANTSAWRRLVNRFRWAGCGVGYLFRTQANARIHAGAALVALAAGWYFHITRLEWCAVVFAIGLVLVAEGFNTAVEAVVDLASPEHHPLAGRAKDVAAGAVLLAALAAAIIGCLVFLPHLLLLFP
jgi:diacylglycerol kinase (ATP)